MVSKGWLKWFQNKIAIGFEKINWNVNGNWKWKFNMQSIHEHDH